MQTLTSPIAPPRLKGLPLIGSTWHFLRDPLRFLLEMQEKYERVVTVKLLLGDITLLLSAEETKYVLQENNRNYHKSKAYEVLAIFLGNGLLNSEGDFWRRQRKLAQPAFYKHRLALMTEMMVAETGHLLKDWEATGAATHRNITADLLGLALNVVTKALFSTDVGDKVSGISDALNEIMHYGDTKLKSVIKIPVHYPTAKNRRFLKAVQKVEAVIYQIINSRRKALEENPDVRYDDLLDMLLHTRDEETGEGMSDRQLRDEVTTIFMAGHETTANALSWALFLLAKHPEVLQKMREEAIRVLGERGTPTFENSRELIYSMQVVQEVLRLYPPAWLMGRKALEKDQLGKYQIKKNSYVLISPYALHRHPAYWDHPEDFNPDRFAPGAGKDRPTYAYIPFGGGPRICIGNNFALLEMQVLLTLMVRDFNFERVSSQQEVIPDPMITLRPKENLLLKVVRK